MLLVHDEKLLGLVDAWLTGVPGEAFTDVLPLLRRTFSAYEPGVRRTLGELVRRGPAGGAARPAAGGGMRGFASRPDAERADAAVVPVLRPAVGPRTPTTTEPTTGGLDGPRTAAGRPGGRREETDA
ncbi:hypothetical protein SFUMM280S_08643 [Streptomyces fumanus]